jgi:hypothetical protein
VVASHFSVTEGQIESDYCLCERRRAPIE